MARIAPRTARIGGKRQGLWGGLFAALPVWLNCYTDGMNWPWWLRISKGGGLVIGVLDGELSQRPIGELDYMEGISVTVVLPRGVEGEVVLETLARQLRGEALRVQPKAQRVLFTDVISHAGSQKWEGRGVCVRS